MLEQAWSKSPAAHAICALARYCSVIVGAATSLLHDRAGGDLRASAVQ